MACGFITCLATKRAFYVDLVMKRLLFLGIFVFFAISNPASAELRFGLLKAYAGFEPVNYLIVEREARYIVRNGVVVPDESVIECDKKARIFVGFYIIPSRIKYVSFEETWYYPHLLNEDGTHEDTHSKVYRRAMGTKTKLRLHWVSWFLKKNYLIDGDIMLELHKDKNVLLRHTFQIRGCDSAK